MGLGSTTAQRNGPATVAVVAVIETMTFRLTEGADEEAFLVADKTLQSDFAYQQPGLARRTTARGEDGTWIVIDLWTTAEAADACAQKWDTDPATQAFMQLVDRATVQVARFETLD
jgi:hypothetical protein